MRSFFVSALVLVALAAAAFADGVVVPGVAIVKPARTPDQRALLRFDGAVETLVIETTVQGEGRDFAWIVPLPAAPRIEASTTGLFPTLSFMCAPEVIDERAAAKRGDDGFGWTIVLALGLGLWATVRWRRASPLIVAVVLVPVLVVVGFPGCGAEQQSVATTPASVTVLSRAQIGVFDTATLNVRDPAALRAWLDENGFRAPDGVDDVVAAYAKDGWVFVASKIRREKNDSAVANVHPLAFTFPAKEAVYPMRLTGAVNDSVELELYVVGDRRADVPGLDVACCEDVSMELSRSDVPVRPAGTEYFAFRSNCGETWRRCFGATVLTKLTAELDRAAMARDLVVRWVDFEMKRTTYVTDGVAWRRARIPAACAFAAVLLCGAIAARRRGATRARIALDGGWFAGAVVVAAIASGVAWHAAPRLPDGATVAPRPLDELRMERGPPLPPTSVYGDAAAVREWARSNLGGRANPFTGEPVREEDSPGNWHVRETDGRVELVIDRPYFTSSVLNVSRLASIEGTVRTADGKPVAGASVRLTETESTPAVGEFFSDTLTAVADDGGRYRLDVPVGRTWHLSVVQRGHPYLLRRDFDLHDRRAQAMDLVLPKERTVHGRALDSAGRPLSGARIHACRRSPFIADLDDDVTTSAADGTFTFDGFDADAPEIQVWLAVEQPKDHYHGEVLTIRPRDPPVDVHVGKM